MDESQEIDLSRFTFEEFVRFFFDRPDIPEEKQFHAFHRPFELCPDASPLVVIEHMTKLFEEFGRIGAAHSLQQLDQGLWAMLGPSLELNQYLWDERIALEKRQTCIRSMYFVFANYLAHLPEVKMETSFFMWWDFVAKQFWFDLEFRQGVPEGDISRLGPDSKGLMDTMFESLRRILELPDDKAQSAALHGLGHLHHPEVKLLVQGYIDGCAKGWTEEHLQWVKQCRDGAVM